MAPKEWMNICGGGIGVKMNSRPTVIVDADAIIAQSDPNDIHHQTAVKISQTLNNLNANVIYPSTAIAESNAYMQRVLNSTASAYATAVIFSGQGVQIAGVGGETLKHALKYFSPDTSKKNTLFDCIVAALAEEYNADAVFSFDSFYKKKGFKPASEL
jgi:predicted nucleic acid-binding protein